MTMRIHVNNVFSSYNNYVKYLDSGLHLVCFVSSEEIGEISNRYSYYGESKENYMAIATAVKRNGEYTMADYSEYGYQGFSGLAADQKLYTLGDPITALESNQVIVPLRQFTNVVVDYYSQLAEQASKEENHTLAEAYNAITVAYNYKCGELHDTSALNSLGYTVDSYYFFSKLIF